ncbi:hypothetical protein JL193_11235 [Polaribacter batillariae]|uniref:DUF2207 domain-containing protein n=1 Tax=Polaribacter batillariae TaxID=2808900 RepID=A0ABX7SR47_9FLAO|nr:hypothetical protein [Polaribacter batillariae]QTD36710.1 hypothetical protein JL193_11235 [Polaribacter batillariae]
MKKFCHLFIIFIVALFLVANSAQPGVWNAGGSGSFTLLYPEDSMAYKKIQMKSENIYMQLYKGFATVKGDYYFKNTAKDTLKIKVGYPINTVFENVRFHNHLNEVRVDGLYKIKGLTNEKELKIFEKPNLKNENWYVWEVVFPPKEITKFTVYFLVNTNNAKITQGYNSDKKNAFIYLIETGYLWKSPIEKGNFYAELKDNISLKNIKVASPALVFSAKNILHFSMEDYGKKPDENFVITYGRRIENFNFKEITKSSDSYFSAIDKFSTTNFKNLNYKKTEFKNPYDVSGTGNFLIKLVYYLSIYGIPLLILIFVFFLVRKIIRNIKK